MKYIHIYRYTQLYIMNFDIKDIKKYLWYETTYVNTREYMFYNKKENNDEITLLRNIDTYICMNITYI